MVHIPTTERRFHNVGSKVNSLGVTSQAMLPVAKQYKQTLLEQQKVKIDTLSTKARIDIDNKVNQWRLDNQAKPDDPEAKAQLQTDIQEILSGYGSQIDPIAKMDWDTAANKLSSGYEIAQNQWTLNQRAENAKLDVAENMNLNLMMAFQNGGTDNQIAALANLVESSEQLMDYAIPNMGETEAKKFLKDYKSDFISYFLLGSNQHDPYKAKSMLQEKDVQAALGNPEKILKLQGIIDKSIKKLEKDTAVVSRYKSPSSIYDPKNKDDKKEVDYLFNLETSSPDMTDDEKLGAGLNIAVKTGIMSTDTRKYIRGYLRNGTPEQAMTAAASIMYLKNINPQILNDLSNKDIAFGNLINTNIERGYSASVAYTKAVDAMNVPENIKKAREDEYNNNVLKKSVNESFLVDYFETSPWFSADYDIPAEMKSEFNAAVKNEYLISGDLEAAQNTSAINMSKLWGKSRFNNSKALMRQAPEKIYGVSGLSDEENYEWMHEQLMSDINKNELQENDPERVKISPSLQTRNGMAVYDIFIVDEDGVINMLPQKWQPDWEKSAEYKRRREERQKETEAEIEKGRVERLLDNNDYSAAEEKTKEFFEG